MGKPPAGRAADYLSRVTDVRPAAFAPPLPSRRCTSSSRPCPASGTQSNKACFHGARLFCSSLLVLLLSAHAVARHTRISPHFASPFEPSSALPAAPFLRRSDWTNGKRIEAPPSSTGRKCPTFAIQRHRGLTGHEAAAMTRPRKDVKFPHRSNASNGKIRRTSMSMSDMGDNASTPASPARPDSAAATNPLPSEYEKKKQNFFTRTVWTLIMIAGFFWAMFAGHIFIIMLITAVQLVSFKEVTAIANVPSKARSLRFTKALNWYFLGTTMYFFYGESVIYYFKHILLVDRILLPLATHHRFISFVLYLAGFVVFVGSLQKGHYRFQFTQFAWTHMALMIIVVQAHFVINNVFEGMFWFFLPVALVITNDIFAYLCGITFGRTPLIQISPKKTWEGFLGAWFFTVLFSIGLTNVMSRYKYFICPVNVGQRHAIGSECSRARTSVPICGPDSSAHQTPSLYRASSGCQWHFRRGRACRSTCP